MTQVVIGDILPYTQAFAILNQTVFGTNWTANAASDVVVYKTPVGDDPDDVTQILPYPAGYSVAFIGAELEVQVTLVTPAAAGDIVTVTRQTPADRMNLYTNTNFLPTMLNNDFGILTLVDQQAQLVDQKIAPRYNYSAIIRDVIDTILPVLGANEFWAKNPNDDEIIAINIGTIVSGGTVTQINTGTGLTGGPITQTGTISFAAIAANTFWANITSGSAVPTQVSTSYFLKSANNLSDLTNVPQARINLGLEIGVDVEAWSAALDSIAGLTTSANQLLYTTASNTYSLIGPTANSVLATDGSSVPSLVNTLPSTVQTNITKLGIQSQALDMGSHKIVNLTDPTNPQDAATMAYVTGQTTGVFLPLTGGTMQGIINMGNHKITNLTDPSSGQDAVTLTYLNTSLAAYLPLTGGTMSGQINMGSNKITNLLDPTNPQDAATRNYVDSVATGFSVQPACYAATTLSLNATYLNGASGIGATLTNAGALVAFATDGTSPPTNARILVWQQSTALQNGIYTLTNQGSGAVAWILTRATDYDQPAEIQPGDLVIINNGTAYAGSSFIETASVSSIGVDAINFSQFTFSATAVLLKANNLSDVANTTSSFNNISPLTTKGDLIAYSSQNIRLGVGTTNGQILQVDSAAATGLAWSTATYPVTTTANQLLYSSATNVVGGLTSAVGGILVTDASGVPSFLANPSATGKILQSVNGLAPAYSTPTYPSISGSAGKVVVSDGTNNVYSTPTFPNVSATDRKIIVSDGTNWVASTETYPVPGTSGNIMQSNGTNWISTPDVNGTVSSGLINQLTWYAATGTTVSGLATIANGVLVTSAGSVPSISTTLPADIAMTTPHITTNFKDANGNIIIGLNPSASAVNYFQFQNAATTFMPSLALIGPDTNITGNLFSKGTGGFNIQGFSDNTNAPTGYIGEFVTSAVSAVAITTATSTNVTSISLTAGDWDLWGNVYTNPAGTTTQALLSASISTTTTTPAAQTAIIHGSFITGINLGINAPNIRLSLAATTTVYLVASVSYAVSTLTISGTLSARRRR